MYCDWTQEDEDSDTWVTSCGKLFDLYEGAPSENKMKYCCYCGNEIKEHLFIPEPEPESEFGV